MTDKSEVDRTADALYLALTMHAARHSGQGTDWLDGYREGVEHTIELLRAGGVTARAFLDALRPFE